MKNLLFIIIFISFVISCKESDSFLPKDWPGENLPHYSMNPIFKGYFKPANEGTEYFYIDTTTGNFDTMRIDNIDEVLGIIGDPYTGEGYNISFVSTATSNFRARLRTNSSYSYYQHIYSSGSGCNISNENGQVDLITDYISYEENVSILGQTYTDILKVYSDDQFYEEFWFAKDIGIILKKPRNLNKTYLLRSYKLK